MTGAEEFWQRFEAIEGGLVKPVVTVRHNIEVAHRLSRLEGNKCQQIHGHSMWIELLLEAADFKNGIAYTHAGVPLEFGAVKQSFRHMLDTRYDHHLLLWEGDPWAGQLSSDTLQGGSHDLELQHLPGLTRVPDDPTTENIALWVAEWAMQTWACDAMVKVQETHVNGAIVTVHYTEIG